jgi:hypothetical protein
VARIKVYSFYLFLFSLFAGPLAADAQTIDTLKARYDTLEPRKFTLADFREGFRPSRLQWSNTLDNFQFYHWLIFQDGFNFTTGNLGGPAYLPFIPVDSTTGFKLGITSLDRWNYSLQNQALLSTKVPFTRVAYYFGSKKENLILADHAQSFGNYVSGGFRLKRISSEGFYNNGKNTSTDFDLYLKINSRNFRYQALTSFLTGNNKNEENGGVAYAEGEATSLQSVNLSEGYSVWKRTGALWSHSYSLGKPVDSLSLDSVRKRGLFAFKIGHELEFLQQKFAFSDPIQNKDFYPNPIGDSILLDSFKIQTLQNKLFLSHQNSSLFLRKWTAGIRNTLIFWTRENQKGSYNNNAIWGDIRLGFGQSLFLDASAQVELTGYNKGDFAIRPAIQVLWGQDSLLKPNLRAGILLLNQTPAMLFSHWISTHFGWANNLSKSQIFRADASFRWPKQKLEIFIAYKSLRNHTYLNAESKPTQFANQLQVLEWKAEKTFRWKKWAYYIAWNGQFISHPDVLPLPGFWGRTGLFFESWVFKRAMLLRTGTDLAYCNGFKGFSYQPEIFQWYVNPNGPVGNAYSLDIYLSARVKRSSFFFKYERLNSLWDRKPAYTVSGYPFPGGAMKFGINWIFMDYIPKADKDGKGS